jgi:hypothetical protein
MKKKLLVILGAGSSIARGMPSVQALDRHMGEWGRDWALSSGFPDYFDVLRREIETYCQSGPTGARPELNFEKVLGEMVALSHWIEPAPWGDTLRQAACNGLPPPNLHFPNLFSGHEPYGATVMLMDQLKHLLVELAGYIRGLCRSLDPFSAAAGQYALLFDRLRDTFDVGVYNLNYDTAALAAWPNAYTGFGETGAFEPRAVHNRPEWGFVYHLHGSAHHSLDAEFGSQICWRQDLGEKFFDGHQGGAGDKRSEGRSFPKTTLIAGGFKLDQLLVEPFHSLHASLVRHAYAADAFLIGGYGFGDVHINRALQNRLLMPGAKAPVIVLDHAGSRTDPMAFREDFWAYGLSATLGASGNYFVEPGHSSPSRPYELAASDAFEVSAAHRVALWYGGFAEAAARIESIVPWLDGQADEVLISRTAR